MTKAKQARKRRETLKARYGLTIPEYDNLLEKQKGVCAICGGVNASGRRLHVDHCHRTGTLRKLLCSTCNTGIGGLKDSPVILKQALVYLQEYEPFEVRYPGALI